jgi:photosystem II stability/assembly factor-like uncharacterized protein
MLLDAAISPSGNVVAVSAWNVFVSNDNGQSYTAVDGLGGVSQSANLWGENQENFALVGAWAQANPGSKIPTSSSGVAYSTDAGKTWAVSAPVPSGDARYGAFPSANTWYVSSGMWAEDSKSLKGAKGQHSLTRKIKMGKGGYELSESRNVSTTESGWFGAVAKTTDGGKTWTEVFRTNPDDALYFNGISCSSESHCAVVAEGEDEAGNDKTVGYVTFDGGVTWSPSLTTGDLSLIQVKFISELEGWAAGTGRSGRGVSGQFYHTNDGGKTWELAQVSPFSSLFVKPFIYFSF